MKLVVKRLQEWEVSARNGRNPRVGFLYSFLADHPTPTTFPKSLLLFLILWIQIAKYAKYMNYEEQAYVVDLQVKLNMKAENLTDVECCKAKRTGKRKGRNLGKLRRDGRNRKEIRMSFQ